MATASPTPFLTTSFPNIRPKHTSTRTFPRAQPSRPALQRHGASDRFSHGQGFNADAAMLQSISYGDSSDDEMPQPMKFSALTKAILEDRPPAQPHSRSPSRQPYPKEIISTHAQHGPIRNASQQPVSRTQTPPKGASGASTRSPSPHARHQNSSPPRVVHLSGSRHSAGLRRTSSSAEVLPSSAIEIDIAKEYITPAPIPRKRPLRSRTNSMTSGPSSQAQSLGCLSGTASSGRGEHAALNFEPSADQGQHVGDNSFSRAPSRAAGEALPGSTRMKRLNIGSGTFLKGAPMRRPLQRRQSEEDGQSAQEDDQGGSMLEIGSAAARRPASRDGFQKSSRSNVDTQDFADQNQLPYRGIKHAEPARHDSRQAEHHQPLQPEVQNEQVLRPSRESSSRQPAFRIPAPPVLPSSHDQENEPPPTFKRNLPQSSGLLGMVDKKTEDSQSKMLADTSGLKSPKRLALAPRNINTPQRAPPPPPPKMSVLETATATAGASTVKSKRKRSHITINGKIFSLKGRLGKGGSSDVYRVMAENDKMFALKKVNLEDCNEDTVRGYKGEIELLKKLENVDRVVRLFDWEINDQKQSLSVLMEIGESDLNRILGSRMQPEDSRLDLSFVRHYWRETLHCVEAVHAYDIVHSDLKPANFLLVQGRLKLIDFGIANAIDTDNTVNVHRESNVGTPNYMSPESLQDTNAPARSTGQAPSVAKLMKLGKPSDVWSLGCILYQMTYGKPPFAHIANQWNRVMAIINPSVEITYAPTGVGGAPVPSSLKRLLKSCLNRNAAQRPTLAQLLDPAEPFLNPDVLLDRWDAEGAVPVSEHVLEQILSRIVERCRDPKRGCPTQDELKVYPRAFLDRVKEMRGM